LRRELARKGLHLLSTTVPVSYAAGVAQSLVIWVLAFALAVALVVEMGRWQSPRARGVFDSTVGGLLREHERRAASGATWLIVALLAATVCLPRDVAIAAMCAVTLGDALAAVIGRALSRATTYSKSFSGSAACFAASAMSARAIAGFSWREALLVGVLAAVAERPRRPLDDNLRIVIVVGCGILLWRMGFS
jgi:dolichol kinase